MYKHYPSILVRLTILLLSTNFISTLACTDTVVTRAEDPIVGDDGGSVHEREGMNESGNANRSGEEPTDVFQRDSSTNSCEGTGAQDCVPCTQHSDCTDSACDRARGRCVPCIKEGEVTVGCSDETPICAIDENDSTENRCVECIAHDNCDKAVCDVGQNRCVPCLVDEETTIGCSDEQPVCETTENNDDNRCVGCVEHADCESGACDADRNACVPCLLEDDTSIGCDQDGDTPVCMVGEEASENRCVACLEHDDCGSAVCDSSRRICVACLIDDDEPIGCDDQEKALCKVDDDDSENNACVECLEMSDCTDPTASACDSGSNQCTGCSEDADCDGIDGLNACDDGLCVECTDSEIHCSDTTPICSDNKCQACESHDQCDFAAGVCNATTGACYQSDEVVYVDEVNCESGADGSRERPYCQVTPALHSIDNHNSTRIPILVKAGTYSSFTVSNKEPISIIGAEGAIVVGREGVAAVLVRDNSDVIVEGLEVSLEETEAGIECEGKQGENPSSQPTVIVRDVTVTGGQFGVRSTYNCSLTLENSEITGNMAGYTIGVDLRDCSDSSDIRVYNNYIYNYEDGISVNGFSNEIVIENNAIMNNTKEGVFIGLGSGTIKLSGNRIRGANVACVNAMNTSGLIIIEGNELLLGAFGLILTQAHLFEVRNNIIAKNGTGAGGGGVEITPTIDLYDVVFHSNTVVDNKTGAGGVGGVSCSTCIQPLIIENTIVYNNTGKQLSDLVKAVWSIISDNSGDQSAIGNRDDDPKFVLPESDDYHLQSDSPAIDRGGSHSASHAPDTDIDGDPRPQGDGIDIGADEAG